MNKLAVVVVLLAVSTMLGGCPAVTGTAVPVNVGDYVTIYQSTQSFGHGQISSIKGQWIEVEDVVDNVVEKGWVNTQNVALIKITPQADVK